MSGFCGWIGEGGSVESRREILERMATPLGTCGDEDRSFALGDCVAIGASGRPAGPRIHEHEGYRVVVHGNPRLVSPGGEPETAETQDPIAALLKTYREVGERVLDRLRGGYALAIVSPDGQHGLLAVDRVGGRFPLSYKAVDGCLVFATHGACIQAHPRGESEIDPQGIYNYLYFHVTPSPRSIRKGVVQLAPAGYLLFSKGNIRTGTYWRPSFRGDERATVPELCEEFREVIRASVELCAPTAEVGCFLSGGTDSSTIAGYLGRVTGSPARTYAIGFDAEGYDEMQYARVAVDRFGTRHHEYYVTPDDVLKAIPSIARSYAEPFGNASAVPVYHCARLAREDGTRHLLGGDGGDELFAGNKRYAMQRVFAYYETLPPLARRALESVVFRFSEDTAIAPIRKMRSYISQAKIPMPQRLQTYNHLERIEASGIIDPDFMSTIDLDEPRRLQAEVYRSVQATTMLNRMLGLDLKFTIADDDLRKVSAMCDLAGVDVAYPFLSDEMIEFSCRVPARLKLKGFNLRWFFKHALRDFLPKEILRKKKHGFGLPFGVWMRDHPRLREFALENLEHLKGRRFVRAEYIDELVRLHETVHATYYGVMIWVLMMLEQWYRQHEDRA